MAIKKVCPNCEMVFETYPSINKKTCSNKCAFEYQKKQTIKRKQRPCKVCGKIFVPKHPKSPGLYCSYKCRAEQSKKPIIMRSGYRYIHLPTHPYASKQGYYAEHRYIMENILKRILDRKEIVHHINHVKADNRVENLCLMADSSHKRLHATENLTSTRPEVRKKISLSQMGNTVWKTLKRNHKGQFAK